MLVRGRTLGVVVACVAVLAPAVTVAAATATAANANQPGGVELDAWGGLHPFGGFTLSTAGAFYQPGWDIARAMAIRDDGSGGWTLDGYGAIHAFGSAHQVASPVWTPGADTARDLAMLSTDAQGYPDGAEGWVLTADGAIHSWGGAPALSGPTWPGQDVARGLLIHADGGTPDGAWVLLRDGTIVSAGAAPAISLQDERVPAAWQHLHANADGTMWALADWGVTTGAGAGSAPSWPETASWTGYADWGSQDLLRDLHVSGQGAGATPPFSPQPVSRAAMAAYRSAYRPPGGVSLDAWGGLHSFGGWPLDKAGAPYWYGFEIARALVTREDGGGGWTLDGFGGIHAFGTAPSTPASAPYWPGWDIARAVVITSHDAHGNLDGRQGYVLDGWGGVHPFGGAPSLPQPSFWPGWDIARGLDVHLSGAGVPDGLLVLDAWGGLHSSGSYPAVTTPPSYPGHEAYQKLERTSDGKLYAVTHFGWVYPMGVQDVSTSPWQTAAPMAVYWSGYADFGVWDLPRDVATGRSDNPAAALEPVSWAAANAFADRTTTLWTRYLNAPSLRQDKPLDCEAAATAAALGAIGVNASQDWIFANLPVDTRPAMLDNGVPVMWGDAWTAFVGDVNGSQSRYTGYGVYYGPVQALITAAGFAAYGGQNWTLTDLEAEVDRGHPVVIWVTDTWQFTPTSTWTGFDGNTVPYTMGEHSVLLYGVDPNAQTVAVMDVGTGTYRTFGWGQFASFMATWANMALAVE